MTKAWAQLLDIIYKAITLGMYQVVDFRIDSSSPAIVVVLDSVCTLGMAKPLNLQITSKNESLLAQIETKC